MAQNTIKQSGQSDFRRTMSQGLDAFRGRDIPNYSLLFLDNTLKKSAGMHENIVVPYIELGRSNKCHIRYGEDYPTVSRVHAAIRSQNGQFYIKHLGTNPTLINGYPINDIAQLNNGDEIQLSHEGPKLRFNTSTMKTSTMKFTQRMSLYTAQALKPYRQLVIGLATALLLLTLVGSYFLWQQSDKIKESQVVIAGQSTQLKEQQSRIHSLDSMINIEKENRNRLAMEINNIPRSSPRYRTVRQQLYDADRSLNELQNRRNSIYQPNGYNGARNTYSNSSAAAETNTANDNEYAQNTNAPSNEDVNRAVANALKQSIYIIYQGYALHSGTQREAQSSGQDFGGTYGLGVAANGKLWALTQTITPWDDDPNFNGHNNDNPYRTRQGIRNMDDRSFRDVNLNVGYDIQGYIGFYTTNIIGRYATASPNLTNSKGYLMMVYTEKGYSPETADLKYKVYTVSPNWSSDRGALSRNIAADFRNKRLFGGAFFVEQINDDASGHAEYVLSGLYRTDNSGQPYVENIPSRLSGASASSSSRASSDSYSRQSKRGRNGASGSDNRVSQPSKESAPRPVRKGRNL